MEISPNVDDMLIEAMSGQKLDPLPEKPIDEVSRETNGHESIQLPAENGSGAASVDELGENSATKKEERVPPKTETNEYGDKTASENGLEKTDSPSSDNEYGLEAEAPKTYTKAEMDAYANQLIRDRLARLERNSSQQATQQQAQQHEQATQQGFQYDENSNLDWQQQLEQFTMQVIDKREQQKAAQLQKAIEQEQLQAFESKFKNGMSKFSDYHEVLAGKNVTDEMLMAASDISDPAALFYAAAKRMPQELEKIAQIQNPYAQAAAIGRLDEKLRKQPVKTSSAPKPVSKTTADTTTAFQSKQDTRNELDDLLVADNKARVAQLNARRR